MADASADTQSEAEFELQCMEMSEDQADSYDLALAAIASQIDEATRALDRHSSVRLLQDIALHCMLRLGMTQAFPSAGTSHAETKEAKSA